MPLRALEPWVGYVVVYALRPQFLKLWRVVTTPDIDLGASWGYSEIRRTAKSNSITLWRLCASIRAYSAYTAMYALQGTGSKLKAMRGGKRYGVCSVIAVPPSPTVYSTQTSIQPLPWLLSHPSLPFQPNTPSVFSSQVITAIHIHPQTPAIPHCR